MGVIVKLYVKQVLKEINLFCQSKTHTFYLIFKAVIGNQDLSYKMYLHLQELREPFLQGMQAKMASIKSEVKKHFAHYELLVKVDYLHSLTI